MTGSKRYSTNLKRLQPDEADEPWTRARAEAMAAKLGIRLPGL